MYLPCQVVFQKQQKLVKKDDYAFKKALKNTCKQINNDLYRNSVIRLFGILWGFFSIEKNESPTMAATTSKTNNLDEIVIDARAASNVIMEDIGYALITKNEGMTTLETELTVETSLRDKNITKSIVVTEVKTSIAENQSDNIEIQL